MPKRPPRPHIRTTAVSEIANSSKSTKSSEKIVVPIDQISVRSSQPRRYFDADRLEQLTTSIQEFGILEPLLVRANGTGYELIAGERRLRAAQQAGLSDVPIVVHDLTDKQAVQVALMENLQREDLNPVEETEAILDWLCLEFDCDRPSVISLFYTAANAQSRDTDLKKNVFLQIEKIKTLFAELGRFSADSFRTSRLPLLNLPNDVLKTLREGKIQYTKAQAIARVQDKRKRTKLLKEAIAKDLPLSTIRERVDALKPAPNATPERIFKKRWTNLGQQISKSQAWQDEGKQQRISELLDELEHLTQS
jgi:ParB family chromosome partitioning protein